MRSLTTKLTLAFLLVGAAGVVLVAAVVRLYTQSEFSKLVLDQNQQVLLNNLAAYYIENGSWNGVEYIFRPPGNPPARVNEWRWESRRTLFAIADMNGFIVYGENPKFMNRNLSARELGAAVPIQVEGRTVGWLVFAPTLDRWNPGTLEGDFLLGVQQAIWFSALAASGIALILGGILALTLTRSLRKLTAATQELAQGRLGLQVEVHSQDELGQLAHAFNDMSTRLAHSVELRRKMTADIAHDLRTPLSVILGYTEALSDGKLKPDSEMYSVIHTEALHLSHLIDDLKVLSLADAGELPLNIQPVEPGKLMRRAAETYQMQSEQKQVSILTELAADLPEIRVDVERMAQVLGNLMSNALRYTPAGGSIRLSAQREQSTVVLGIADSGSGIAEEDLPYIFERSFHGDKARQQQSGETGLGLAIVKSLVEAQGGRVEVKSAPGQGAQFLLFFPA